MIHHIKRLNFRFYVRKHGSTLIRPVLIVSHICLSAGTWAKAAVICMSVVFFMMYFIGAMIV